MRQSDLLRLSHVSRPPPPAGAGIVSSPASLGPGARIVNSQSTMQLVQEDDDSNSNASEDLNRKFLIHEADPQLWPISDHYFHTCRPSVRPSPLFKIS